MSRRLAAIFLLLANTVGADTLLVVNRRDATLSFVDLAAMEVTGTVVTGDEPHEVAVSNDGSIAVVSNYGTGDNPGTSLSVVDVNSRKELRRFQLPGLSRPHGIEAVGSRFYLTAEGSMVVARYDAVTHRIDWVAGTGQAVTHMLAVARDEKKIYTTNIGSNSVSVVNLSAPRDVSLKQIAVTRGPEALDFTPDGSALWVAGVAGRGETARISVIDTKSDTVVRTIPIAAKLANRLKFADDGSRVVVSDPGTNQVFILTGDTGEVVKVVSTAEGPSGLLFSRDGKRLFVACAYAAKVQIIDTATWTIAGEVAMGTEPDGMAYVAK